MDSKLVVEKIDMLASDVFPLFITLLVGAYCKVLAILYV